MTDQQRIHCAGCGLQQMIDHGLIMAASMTKKLTDGTRAF